MAGSITHAFVSAIADGADATLVRPQSNWNAGHVFSLSLADISETSAGWIGHPSLFPYISPSWSNPSWNQFSVLTGQIPMTAIAAVLQLGGF